MATSKQATSRSDLYRHGGCIRVFIIDDSSFVRSIYSRLIEAEPGLELAGTAGSAEEALAQLPSLHVNVILLDLEMPGMGGMRALPEIIRRAESAKVMVVSSLTSAGAERTVEALALGAADTLQKPEAGGYHEAYKQNLVERIRALGRRNLRREHPDQANVPVVSIHRAPPNFCAKIVAIGASTGGIHATGSLLGVLPDRIGVPILITQHLPGVFSAAFARQLHDVSGRRVEVATDGLELVPDMIVLAPGDAHLCIERNRQRAIVRLDNAPAPSGCLPSVDRMFESLAQAYGAQTLGVVLTGMGRDGTDGAQKLVDAGSCVVVQNEASSVVWGMPGSIARAGLASAVLHPHDLAARIVHYTKIPA